MHCGPVAGLPTVLMGRGTGNQCFPAEAELPVPECLWWQDDRQAWDEADSQVWVCMGSRLTGSSSGVPAAACRGCHHHSPCLTEKDHLHPVRLGQGFWGPSDSEPLPGLGQRWVLARVLRQAAICTHLRLRAREASKQGLPRVLLGRSACGSLSPGPLAPGEGTTRRGTATPVHRPQRPAGSTHSSTRALPRLGAELELRRSGSSLGPSQ